MKEVSFFVDINPQPWQRPKTRVVNGFVKHYSPVKTKKYENQIADAYMQIKDAPFFEKDIPLRVAIHFDMPVPKSVSERKRNLMCTGVIEHTKRPDVDNMGKAVLDALNGIAWADDAQITALNLRKRYATHGLIWVHIVEDCD